MGACLNPCLRTHGTGSGKARHYAETLHSHLEMETHPSQGCEVSVWSLLTNSDCFRMAID